MPACVGNEAAATIDAGLAAVAMTGAATFFGVTFLIVGLVLALGGRREVAVVKAVG